MQKNISIWGIKNCNTMKKAFNYLDDHHVNYQFHDYKKEIMSTELLQQILKTIPLEQLLNKKSTTWRSLTEKDKEKANDQTTAVELMQNYPTLIKRPIIELNDSFLVGFSEENYEQFFKSNLNHD